MEEENKNIYQKLQEARVELQEKDIKKSGENNHTHFKYYELGDIMPYITPILAKYTLTPVISFGIELATLTLVNWDAPTGDQIIITSPMSEAKLSGGCSPVQNVGACETYQRRYLMFALFDLTDGDALDANVGKPEPKAKAKPKAKAPEPPPKPTRAEVIARIVKGEPAVYPLKKVIDTAREKYLGTADINEEIISTETLEKYLIHIVEKYKEMKEKENAKSE